MIILPAVLIAILLALFVGYRVIKWAFPPRPTLHAQADFGTSTVNEGRKALAIDFQLVLNSRIDEGKCEIHTDEPNLIQFVRRAND